MRFDNNKYSVNASAVGDLVKIQAYADRVVIKQDWRLVATEVGSTSATLDCFGRRFLDDVRPSPDVCAGASCLSLKGSMRGIGMRIELIDASGSVINTIPINFASFPMLNIGAGRSEPSPSVAAFFNYCAPDQQPFYALAPNDAAYGDVLVLPAPGSRFRAYGNFLLPNEVIARTATLRINVVNNSQGAQRLRS